MLGIVEIIRKMQQGKTEPWLCRAENERLYVVKGQSALISGCIKELLCGAIGREFGLPIPDCRVLTVPEELLDLDCQYRLGLGELPVFASEFQDHLEEINRTILQAIDPQLLRDVFIFDYWIKNEDRLFTNHGGNPNLFYRSSDQSVTVIDHNLAFDDQFDVESFKAYHLGRDAWFSQVLAELSINYYKEKMESVMEKFDKYCDNLPAQWLQTNKVSIDDVKSQLFEFKEDYFWNPLK